MTTPSNRNIVNAATATAVTYYAVPDNIPPNIKLPVIAAIVAAVLTREESEQTLLRGAISVGGGVGLAMRLLPPDTSLEKFAVTAGIASFGVFLGLNRIDQILTPNNRAAQNQQTTRAAPFLGRPAERVPVGQGQNHGEHVPAPSPESVTESEAWAWVMARNLPRNQHERVGQNRPHLPPTVGQAQWVNDNRRSVGNPQDPLAPPVHLASGVSSAAAAAFGGPQTVAQAAMDNNHRVTVGERWP